MNTPNRINYVEFQAPDLDVITGFYTRVFGWEFTDYGPEYVAFTDGAFEGGFMKGNQTGSHFPLVILYSNTLEDMLGRIESHGGKILKPIYTFPGGRRFHFSDPAGNELGVWSDILV